jgi:hypothetical protein
VGLLVCGHRAASLAPSSAAPHATLHAGAGSPAAAPRPGPPLARWAAHGRRRMHQTFKCLACAPPFCCREGHALGPRSRNASRPFYCEIGRFTAVLLSPFRDARSLRVARYAGLGSECMRVHRAVALMLFVVHGGPALLLCTFALALEARVCRMYQDRRGQRELPLPSPKPSVKADSDYQFAQKGNELRTVLYTVRKYAPVRAKVRRGRQITFKPPDHFLTGLHASKRPKTDVIG